MNVKERLESDLKQAMKDRAARRVSCVRMLRAKLLEREVALRAKNGRDYVLTDAEALEVISSYAKQRRESIASYRDGGRPDLVAEEEAELAIVGAYLPQPLSEAELRAIIRDGIAESGASSLSDLGRVMKLVVPRTRGVADGGEVQRLVRELLEQPQG